MVVVLSKPDEVPKCLFSLLTGTLPQQGEHFLDVRLDLTFRVDLLERVFGFEESVLL